MRTQWTCRSGVVLAAVVGLLGGPAFGQDFQPAKPGPEHELLKKMEGTWDATIKMGPNESKGTVTWKMELGGLWLGGDFQGQFAGQPFRGKSLDSYDATKKKYVSIWVDSMSTAPMVSEGTYDKDKKAFTWTGEFTGPDGKPVKHRMVSQWKDDNTIDFTMYETGKDGKEKQSMVIEYKRKK